ncbi:OB-fold nucleic acid binding domain-containing protein, partial [Planctomycetota bacterium]|nr:OB-fold nucleic acid binding domain-containing protein [Planctomycetota bacterium]
MSTEHNEYRQQRERKRDALIELGVDPYAVRTPARSTTAEVRTQFEALEVENPPTEDSKPALEAQAIAGRVLANRKMGKKAIFMDVFDGTGKVQVYLNKKGVGEEGMAIH